MRKGACLDVITRFVKSSDVIDWHVTPLQQTDRVSLVLLARDGDAQALQDAMEEALTDESEWRIAVIQVDATSPDLPERTEEAEKRETKLLRDELISEARDEGEPSADYFILIFLSTVVAAVGLNTDSVAAVIGSMVIAPLLGPVIALSVGTGLGDIRLMKKAGFAIFSGMALVILGSYAIGWLTGVNLESDELLLRAEVGLEGLALAVAAGAAGAISRLKGTAASLVGVMVAAALVPSAAAAGLFLSADRMDLASRAILLSVLNVASLLATAVIIFRVRRISPRRDNEKSAADRAVIVSLVGLLLLLAVVVALIVFLDLGSEINPQRFSS